MQRVTSRQRLFSWDQFDANVQCYSSSDEDSNYLTCLDASSRNQSYDCFDDDDDYKYYNDETHIDMQFLQERKSDKKGKQAIPQYLPSVHAMKSSCADTTTSTNVADTPPSIKRTSTNEAIIKKSVSFSNLVTTMENDVASPTCLTNSSCKKVCNGTTATNTDTTKTTSLLPRSTLSALNQDTQLDLISYLTAEEVQSLGMTCRYFLDMLLAVGSSLSPQDQISSVARNTIWWSLMRNKWPHISLLHCTGSHDPTGTIATLPSTQILFTDSRHSFLETMNFGALLKQASAQIPPSHIDSKYFERPSSISPPVTQTPMPPLTPIQPTIQHQAFATYSLKTPFFTKQLANRPDTACTEEQSDQTEALEETLQVVQFTGIVGRGDRCIRADQPLPRPLESIATFREIQNDNMKLIGKETGNASIIINNKTQISKRKRSDSISSLSCVNVIVPSPGRAFLKILEQGRKCRSRYLNCNAATESDEETTTETTVKKSRFIPFVSPFVVANSTKGRQGRHSGNQRFEEIDLTPRMVSYFEVSILPRDNIQEQVMQEIEEPAITAPQQEQETRQHVSDCVAVGLSVKSSRSRMPGWDSASFGYHGDDGGIFHSRGEMIRIYGPKYGEGDTVGCGVNYENGGIFYTLNGNFLGYAWCDLFLVQEGNTDLYPTVGVDSSCPLFMNFGNDRPFMFDLSSFVASKGSVPTRSP